MKKISIIAFLTAGVVLIACSDVKRKPGSVYMPDMAYSRAYETYAERDSTLFTEGEESWDANGNTKIFYNNRPVAGTVARGHEMPFHIEKDKAGDTLNYNASKVIKSPITAMDKAQMLEAERLYLIHCGICHGAKLDGNGPLWKNGDGPYPSAPKNLIADAIVGNMPEGQMMYSITYGKGSMGSYASQLNRKQRWEVIAYIKSKQTEAKTPAPAPTAVAAPVTK